MKTIPEGALPVNERDLAPSNSYGVPEFVRRGFYRDQTFTCALCRIKKTWTAAQQKLWYEKAKGYVYSTAKYCAACRLKRRGGPQKEPRTPAKALRDPKRVCERLRLLGSSAATPESRREVEGFLENGKQPIQSIAAEVLARWGGRRSLEVLRRWLPKTLKGSGWHAIQIKAANLLATLVEDDDASWIVALFAELKDDPAARYWLHPLFEKCRDSHALLKTLKQESGSKLPVERIRALFFLSVLSVTKREGVFEALKADTDPAVRDLATQLAKDPNSSAPALRILWDRIMVRKA